MQKKGIAASTCAKFDPTYVFFNDYLFYNITAIPILRKILNCSDVASIEKYAPQASSLSTMTLWFFCPFIIFIIHVYHQRGLGGARKHRHICWELAPLSTALNPDFVSTWQPLVSMFAVVAFEGFRHPVGIIGMKQSHQLQAKPRTGHF